MCLCVSKKAKVETAGNFYQQIHAEKRVNLENTHEILSFNKQLAMVNFSINFNNNTL